MHVNYVCDGCGADPIKGIRYKCAYCDDFDFCNNCEKTENHDFDHPFIKIKNPVNDQVLTSNINAIPINSSFMKSSEISNINENPPKIYKSLLGASNILNNDYVVKIINEPEFFPKNVQIIYFFFYCEKINFKIFNNFKYEINISKNINFFCIF